MKRWTAGAAVLVFLNAIGNVWGGVEYTVTDLGTLPGYYGSFAYAINATGQVVGWADDFNGSARAFLFSNGVTTGIGPLPGGANSHALGINDIGQVVGYADSAMGYAQPYLFSNGTMTALGTLPGGAQGINNQGQVTGWFFNASNDPLSAKAFLYSAGTFTNLGTLGRDYSFALDINENGQVVGYYGGAERAFLYADGTMTDLDILSHSSAAQKINSSGQVAGGFYLSDTVWHGFLYSRSTATDLGTLGGSNSWAFGINDSGQVVGEASTAGDAATRAFVYRSGTMIDLNDLIAPASAWTLQCASAINESGQICGWGLNAAGRTEAFLLTPVPEPATFIVWLVLAASGVGVGWRRPRRAA